MVVVETPKSSSDHRVSKVLGPFELHDSSGETLSHAQVNRLPRHLIVEPKQPAHDTGDGSLTGVAHRVRVQLRTSIQVEHALDRRANDDLKVDDRHQARLEVDYGRRLPESEDRERPSWPPRRIRHASRGRAGFVLNSSARVARV